MCDRIVIDSEICHGKPVIRGTRTPVTVVLGALAGGDGFEEIQKDYEITAEDIRACVAFACDEDADLAYYSERAYPANALNLAARSTGEVERAQRAFADTVRAMIPFAAVQPKVEPAVRASQMPPPLDPMRQSHVRGPGFAPESSPNIWFDPDTQA